MPDLDPSSISSSPSLSLVPSSNFIKPIANDAQNSLLFKTQSSNLFWRNRGKENKVKLEDSSKSEPSSDGNVSNGLGVLLHSDSAERKPVKSLNEHERDWAQRKIDAGVPESRCYLSFRVHAPKLAVCLLCQNSIHPGEVIFCSIRGCQAAFHITCAEERLGFLSEKPLKCPQHACYLCKEKNHLWRCTRCPLASHKKCIAFPEHVVHFPDHQGQGICWRHHSDWGLEREQSVPANSMEEVFSHLPLPYIEEEFKFDFVDWKDTVDIKLEPPPYVHIRRNAYLVKRKKDNIVADIGCTHCRSSTCAENCVCRVQCISCSKACRCSETCTNRPFRKDKKISVVKTALCGWGVVAAESINKGDFIIEYIGEVIDDALCEQRLWDMKYKGVKNFYMCEIRKDFTIDATFKGNTSRFLNHSCDPNCKLEKWQVEGETRVGVFASRSIQIGEPLTYDYRFVQFGPEVRCYCGAANCQGYLGTKRKINKVDLCWGSKRRRTATSCLTIIDNNNNNV